MMFTSKLDYEELLAVACVGVRADSNVEGGAATDQNQLACLCVPAVLFAFELSAQPSREAGSFQYAGSPCCANTSPHVVLPDF